MHFKYSTALQQFIDTAELAREKSDVNEAAKQFRETIIPMCNTCSEGPEQQSLSLYNEEQMLLMFRAGAEWKQEQLFPSSLRKPKFKAGDTVRYKMNPKDEITILSVVGESYLVDDPGSGEPQHYSFDYVENNFEL